MPTKAGLTKNIDDVGIWSKIIFGWVSPALRLGYDASLEQHHVDQMFSRHDKSQRLCEQLELATRKYMFKEENQQQKYGIHMALLSTHRATMLRQSGLIAVESLVKLAAPLFLKRFLELLTEADDSSAGDSSNRTTDLWTFAGLISATALILGVTHHQLFWSSMRLGFNIRTSLMAAIHAK
eukprot:7695365-Pyramimonas_sp.AAC.1